MTLRRRLSSHLKIAAALAAIGVAAPAQAQAQSQTPGLWEHTFAMKSASGAASAAMAQAQQQLAALSPAQRQQIEQMMAKSGVVLGANSTTVKACLTKAEAAKSPEARLPAGCTQNGVQYSGRTMRFSFACTQPQPSSGDGEVTFDSDKAYHGHSKMTTSVAGAPQQMDVELSGKWIGTDCGDVKPRAATGTP